MYPYAPLATRISQPPAYCEGQTIPDSLPIEGGVGGEGGRGPATWRTREADDGAEKVGGRR